MSYSDYNATVSAAKANGHEVHYNFPVEGTEFKLTCYVPAFDTAYVSGPSVTKDTDFTALREKMKVVKEKTGITNLMVHFAS